MNFAYIYDHHQAENKWDHWEVDWIKSVFDEPSISIAPRCTPKIRKYVEKEFIERGWALNVKIDQNIGLKIFAEKNRAAFQLQTGNISRVPYDLIKLQYLFQKMRIEKAALALPTRETAKIIGSNLANAERIISELKLFHSVITVPLLVIVFN